MPTLMDCARKVFKYDEGDGRPGAIGKPYKDSNGYWTIGRGHFIGTNLEDFTLPQTAIEVLFERDFRIAEADAIFLLGLDVYDQMTPARKIAVTTLVFTMGRETFGKFRETIPAIKRGDWEAVSDNILKTKWAKDVDPKQRFGEGRDDRVAYMFRTGEFPKEYGV